MGNYISTTIISDNYEMIKIYVLLKYYESYIKYYEVTILEINIFTKYKTYNCVIYDMMSSHFPHKIINIVNIDKNENN